MTRPAEVHIRDASGRLLHTRLLDDGSGVLTGEGPHGGFIDRWTTEQEGCQILPGWPNTAETLRRHQRQQPWNGGHHRQDSDCAVDPETGCCSACGVWHGDPCGECGGRGYHVDGCPEVSR